MSLKKYTSKRNLKRSHEPAPKPFQRKKGSLQFVIQKHAASHLHYDLRLEVNGVLKSWAVPKGPSLNPKNKRLAMMVEDHPYDYKDFEGIIPEGYGAGTVQIWDRGSYSVPQLDSKKSESSMRQGLKKGELKFSLKGEKLNGEFALIRMKNNPKQWLLIKKSDEYATEDEITDQDLSVVSHRSIEEIGSKPKIKLERVPKKHKPHHLKPMLATLIDKPFSDKEWIFEIKWDGYRAIAEVNPNGVELYSRNLKPFNKRFPQIVEQLKQLKIDAIFDGEIVALDKKGISHFQWLQDSETNQNLYYYIFDLLFLEGRDLRKLPLIERKALLKSILPKNRRIRYLDHVEESGKAFFTECEKKGLEGIIGKKKESIYRPDVRTKEWVKIKASHRQEVVICGFTEPRRSRKDFGSLIVGVYRKGRLTYVGHVGGGFTDKELKAVKTKLKPLIQKTSPFATPPHTNTPATWVTPKYLCEVSFREWTNEGIMRQPIFVGLREDKKPKEVEREKPVQTKKIVKKEKQQQYDFLTHLDKLYWKNEKITKGQLLGYYAVISPILLPHLKDRPESLKRYPNGISQPNFFQKNVEHPPEWVSTVLVEHHEKDVNYLLIQDVKSLLYAVNLGCIELHPWFSRYQSLEYPDFLVFDLDPEDISFNYVIETALQLHQVLESIGVPSYCKTSGSRGLHICVPLKAKYTYEQAKQFALVVAMVVQKQMPSIVSLERKPKKRQKKVYLDCLQNNFGQTIASPYSVRAKPGAPVSTPLLWSEVKKGMDPLEYNFFNTIQRLEKHGDLFSPVLGKGIDMQKALKKLKSIYLKT